MATASERVAGIGSKIVTRPRLDSVDLLRGLVMVVMALDHTREFFSYVRSAPEILPLTNLSYFFARWITHFCAPTFFFLAGTGVFLSAARGKKISEVSAFLLKRGAWLVVLEFTLVDFGFSFVPGEIMAGVFYAIGVSLIILAALIRLPVRWVTVIGVATIVGHNLLDRIRPETLGPFKDVWMLLHQPGAIPIAPGFVFPNLYVIVPWFGVTAAGYGLGELLLQPAEVRRRWLLTIGAAATALFFVLRFAGWYGNPPLEAVLIPFTHGAYVPQETVSKSIIAFFNVSKYPPSLQFLLMTLGPALIALAWFDGLDLSARRNWFWRKVVVFGRVPMFYYILHIWLIHVLAIVIATVRGQDQHWLWHGGVFARATAGNYGYSLGIVYLMWVVVVVALYPVCAWFAEYKRTHGQWWLRYL